MNSEYRKPTVILLVTLAVGVWGTVMVRFNGYISVDSVDSSMPNELVPRPTIPSSSNPVPFHGNYTDPFRPTPIQVPDAPVASPDPGAPRVPEINPSYQLKGVIGRTALLHTDIDPTIHYVSVGDSLPGLVILTIQKDSIIVRKGVEVLTMQVVIQ